MMISRQNRQLKKPADDLFAQCIQIRSYAKQPAAAAAPVR